MVHETRSNALGVQVSGRKRPNQADPVEGPTLHIDDDLLLEALAAVERRAGQPSEDERDDEVPIDVDEPAGGAGGEITIQPLDDELVVALESADAPRRAEPMPWLNVPDDLLEPDDAGQWDDERTDPVGIAPPPQAPPAAAEPKRSPRSLLSDPKALQRVSKMRKRIKQLQRKVSELETELDRERQAAHLARSRYRISENARMEAEEQRDNIDRFSRGLRTSLLAQEEELARVQRRSSTEVERARLFGADKTIREILPVLDNLDLALNHADTDPEKFVPGVRMVASLFLRSLERVGVTPIDADPGTPFDPAVHEAILTLPSDEHPPGSVAEEVRRGYMLNERLLRASQVTVVGGPIGRREPRVPEGADDAAPQSTSAGEE